MNLKENLYRDKEGLLSFLSRANVTQGAEAIVKSCLFVKKTASTLVEVMW